MFGKKAVPFTFDMEDISLSMEREGDNLVYSRTRGDDTLEKTISTRADTLFLEPVEPVNLPKDLSPFLQVELDRVLAIEPSSKMTIYLTFPIEFGIFIKKDRENLVVDLLTLSRKKYTLYGEPNNGVVCKYWKSHVHMKPPKTDSIREGFMRLTISNDTGRWMEMDRTVLNAYGMKIYYSEKSVTTDAVMRLTSSVVAETTFRDGPVYKDMKKAIELYAPKKLHITNTAFIMTEGY